MIALNLASWLQLLLVLARVLSFLTTAPLFNRRQIPALSKIGLAMVLSLIVVAAGGVPVERNIGTFVSAFVLEVATGLAAGMLANWLFMSFQMGGALMDQQAGFGIAAIFDPTTFGQVSLLSNLFLMLSLLLFLELNGHHLALLALLRSFALVPAGSAVLAGGWAQVVLTVLAGSMSLALRLAAPVIAAIAVTDITLGMLGRAVPQLNILMLALPVKAGVALLVLAAAAPLILGVGDAFVTRLEALLAQSLGAMSP
jgi:flagellar biosynthetic protein FliR